MKIDFKNMKDINTTTMSRRKLNNKDAFEEMIKTDSKIMSKIKKCMDNGGFVYYFEYRKVIKSIYLFDVKEGVATCSYELISSDIDHDDLDYLNSALMDDLNYLITSKKVIEVVWNNKTITPMTVHFDKYRIPVLIFSVLFGGVLGYMINSFLLGLLFGFTTGFIAFYSMRK
jgi:hypothetical protein